MNWLARLFSRNKLEHQLDNELLFHIEQHTQDLVARGATPEEAKRRARLALGGPEQVKEKCRDARGTRWLEDLAQDTRYALRTFRQNPAFAAIAHRDFDGARRLRSAKVRFRRHLLVDQGLNGRALHQSRIELDQYRCICGMQIENASNALEVTREVENLVVRFKRDSSAERDKKRAVARRTNGHFNVIVSSPMGTGLVAGRHAGGALRRLTASELQQRYHLRGHQDPAGGLGRARGDRLVRDIDHARRAGRV